MISIDLMKSSEVRKAGDRSDYHFSLLYEKEGYIMRDRRSPPKLIICSTYNFFYQHRVDTYHDTNAKAEEVSSQIVPLAPLTKKNERRVQFVWKSVEKWIKV